MDASPGSQPPTTALSTVAVRLADEGIPVRAIARATAIPSEDVYELLRDAVHNGQIVELPRDDWPVGSSRGTRTAFHGTPLEQEQQLRLACCRLFKTSPMEASLLATMIRRSETTKAQLHAVIENSRPSTKRDETDPKMVDVMICKLRKKLLPFDLAIETMWAVGYRITAANRERAIALLLDDAAGSRGTSA